VSKGLGQIERAVLTIFKEIRYDGYKPQIPVIVLARRIYNCGLVGPIPRSQYKSVCRAIKSLERKNYIKTKFQNEKLIHDQATRCKKVMIGPRMYEEKEWLSRYKRFDIKQ